MAIEIKYAEIKNFLSIGNKPIRITFSDEGVILIKGDNGVGKSSLIEMVSWLIFGKVMRTLKKKSSIINKKNKSNMVGEIMIHRNGNEYLIKRGVSPKILMWYKNGEKIENASSDAATQEMITAEVVGGMSFQQFNNTGILRLADKNIADMNKSEGEKFWSSVFKTEVVKVIKKDIKASFDKAKSNFGIITTKIEGESENIKIIKENINNLNNIKENITKQYLKDKEAFEFNINDSKTRIEDFESQLPELKESFDAAKDIYDKAVKASQKFTFNINALKDKVKYFNNDKNVKCNTCLSDLTDEHRVESLKKINKSKKGYETRLSKIDIDFYTSDYNTKSKLYNGMIRNIDIEKTKLKQNSIGLLNLEKNNKNSIDDLSIDKYENDIKSHDDALTTYKTDIQIVEEDLMLDEFILKTVIPGIGPYITNQYISYINNELIDIINKLELSLTASITEDLDIEIVTLGEEIESGNLSSGESHMLNFAILFILLKMRRVFDNNNFNIIFIDEFLDKALSPESTIKLLNIIKEMFSDSVLYLVSHKVELEPYASQIIEVTKEDDFTVVS